MAKIISVFGGSSPPPGSEPYQQAHEVGRLLAVAGFAVATGGYSGCMMAVSQGAAEAGGHVIGVTSAQIEQYRPLDANRWVKEEIKYETLQARLLHLVTENVGMITLPGGIGTLSEMSLAWSLLQVGELSPRPLSLLGAMWQRTITEFNDPYYIPADVLALLHLAETPAAAVAHMERKDR